MKKITLSFLLFFSAFAAQSQVTYFNYLDYSIEWRYYGSGWNGVAAFQEFRTTYFDGHASFNGQTYYRVFTSVESLSNSPFPGGEPQIENYLYGPAYMREDSSGKFWYYNEDTNTEEMGQDNQQIADASAGDAFPYNGSNCNIETVETISAGGMSLKHLSAMTFAPSGVVEGIGWIGPICALGIEGNTILNCYTKGTETTMFGTVACSDFPAPERTFLGTPGNELPQISIYPNPAGNILNISLPDGNIASRFTITNMYGAIVQSGILAHSDTVLDVSAMSSGMYILHIETGNSGTYQKIIKQ